MERARIEDQGLWNYPLSHAAHSQFLQSWEWGVFQQTLGRPVYRFQFQEDEEVLAAGQFVQHHLPLRKVYLYAPRGPVVFSGRTGRSTDPMRNFDAELQVVAGEHRAVFVRCEPTGVNGFNEHRPATATLRSIASVQPNDELVVDVRNDEPALLSAMREKTRYNIRLAGKHGVRSRLIEDIAYARRAFGAFWELVQETALRQRIRSHPRSYYERMLEVLMPRGRLKLMVAEHDNTIVAANLLACFGDTMTYLHGGSSYTHRALMAPYLLHWDGIRHAKQLGYAYYNFGGVAPIGAAEHRWQALTRFKEGFVTVGSTGERLRYPAAFDLVARSFWYSVYSTLRKVRSRSSTDRT